MKEKNCYYEAYNETENRIDYLKHGLLNEFGPNINHLKKEEYNENKIIKKMCNLKKDELKK